MDPDTPCSHKRTFKSSVKSNKDYRLCSDKRENYPNGYVEEWSLLSDSTDHENNKHGSKYEINETFQLDDEYHPNPQKSYGFSSQSNYIAKSNLNKPQHKRHHNIRKDRLATYSDDLKPPQSSLANYKSSLIKMNTIPVKPSHYPPQVNNHSLITDKKLSQSKLDRQTSQKGTITSHPNLGKEILSEKGNLSEAKSLSFRPVSIILSTQDNLLLNKENGYEIRFSTGMLEGKGISINETGNAITFQDDGSYRFEICGEAALFSDVDVSLTYDSDKFLPDIQQFSTVKIPKDEGKLQLRGIPTILPLQKNQIIVPKLIPIPDESILLIGGTRLLIHRVA